MFGGATQHILAKCGLARAAGALTEPDGVPCTAKGTMRGEAGLKGNGSRATKRKPVNATAIR